MILDSIHAIMTYSVNITSDKYFLNSLKKLLLTICVGAAYANSETKGHSKKSKDNQVQWMPLLVHIHGPQHCIVMRHKLGMLEFQTRHEIKNNC